MFENFTIGVCFYETPNLVLPFLKSWAYHHKDNLRLLISENSKSEATSKILTQNNLKFLRNPGMRHAPGIDVLLENCKTKYMILCDSDILILKNVRPLLESFIKNDLTIMGEWQGHRGGYLLYPRISPVFCIIDVEKVKEKQIKFYDQKRIDKTGSNGFFGNVPLQKNEGKMYYDCGSTFLEDIINSKLKVGRINQRIVEYICHAEGFSWRTKSGIKGYIDWGNQVEKEFLEKSKQFENVDIKERFIT